MNIFYIYIYIYFKQDYCLIFWLILFFDIQKLKKLKKVKS